jgi:hypothetical protein
MRYKLKSLRARKKWAATPVMKYQYRKDLLNTITANVDIGTFATQNCTWGKPDLGDMKPFCQTRAACGQYFADAQSDESSKTFLSTSDSTRTTWKDWNKRSNKRTGAISFQANYDEHKPLPSEALQTSRYVFFSQNYGPLLPYCCQLGCKYS